MVDVICQKHTFEHIRSTCETRLPCHFHIIANVPKNNNVYKNLISTNAERRLLISYCRLQGTSDFVFCISYYLFPILCDCSFFEILRHFQLCFLKSLLVTVSIRITQIWEWVHGNRQYHTSYFPNPVIIEMNIYGYYIRILLVVAEKSPYHRDLTTIRSIAVTVVK